MGEIIPGLDVNQNGLAVLLIERNWGEPEWEQVCTIFDAFDAQLNAGQKFTTGDLEKALRDALDMGYQGVKGLVSVLYWSDRWTNVCVQYAESYGNRAPTIMLDIIEDYES